MLEKIFSHATVVSGGDYKSFKDELIKSKINFLSFDIEDGKEIVKNFKIEDIKKIKEFQNSKTLEKRFIISDRSLRSTIVQNALLKIFEEPNENTFLVFFQETYRMLLPTILSRAQILECDDSKRFYNVKNKIIKSKDKNRFEKLERFLILEDYNKRGLVTDKQIEGYIDNI